MPLCVSADIDAIVISDLHLSAEMTHQAQQLNRQFEHFCHQLPVTCRQLFLLGDLFDAWLGDDVLNSKCEAGCHARWVAAQLQQLQQRGVEIFIMVGNRDFLLGEAFCRAVGAQWLPDPSVLTIQLPNGGQGGEYHVLLSHGDALCWDDVAYQQFRSRVREPKWQQHFLVQPLAQRQAIARQIQQHSQQDKSQKTMQMMDVHPDAVTALFAEYMLHRIKTLIHGHTHRPAHHQHQDYHRYVLPDWRGDLTQSVGFSLATIVG